MEYNTQRKKMELPEYGRSIQNMVDHALTIEDREERQRCARTIINIMGNMFPHLRDVPDFKHKLWDHLAIMSDFKLDIDYPFEIVKREELALKPEKLEYSTEPFRYRHYGRFLEGMIKKAMEMEDGVEKNELIKLLTIQMRKNLNNWNKEGIEDQKIVDDLREYTHGGIDLKVEDLRLNEPRPYYNQRRPYNNQRRPFTQRRNNNPRH